MLVLARWRYDRLCGHQRGLRDHRGRIAFGGHRFTARGERLSTWGIQCGLWTVVVTATLSIGAPSAIASATTSTATAFTLLSLVLSTAFRARTLGPFGTLLPLGALALGALCALRTLTALSTLASIGALAAFWPIATIADLSGNFAR